MGDVQADQRHQHRIDAFNERIKHRAAERARIEVDFWKRMRPSTAA